MTDSETQLKNEIVNPIKQHSMKCPKLYGKECSCDGYHTFDELYEHRITLWIALCKYVANKFAGSQAHPVWRSKKHSDGSSYDGWFLLGVNESAGNQITYHLPLSKWETTNFAKDIDKAPEFDGHTSDDVLERIKKL